MDIHAKIDIEKLKAFSNDIVGVLKNNKDVNSLKQTIESANTIRLSCEEDFNKTCNLLEEYEKRINACKQRIEEVKSEVVSDEDLDGLEKELEEELRKELLLTEELRDVNNQISDLEYQRLRTEERKQIMSKSEKDELKAQMMLSMYASVTNIIPDMYDQTKISGNIVEKDKKIVEKFEFDPANASSFEICNNLWKMINM